MWFMNLDAVPPGKAYYTLYVTLDEEVTPDVLCEEVDVILPKSDSWGTICSHPDAHKELQKVYGPDWLDTTIVGVVNQSDGFVVWQDPLSKKET